MYITNYSCVFLKLGESIYVAMDLSPKLLGSLPLAHNAQHSLVILTNIIIGRAGASPPSRTTGPRCLYICIYIYIYVFIRCPVRCRQIPLVSKCLYVNLF